FDHGSIDEARAAFEAAHRQQFGFIYDDKPMIVEAIDLEGSDRRDPAGTERVFAIEAKDAAPSATTRIYSDGDWRDTEVHLRRDLAPGHRIKGPALMIEDHQTIVVEPGWQAT